MILPRTALATVGHLDLLWHQLFNHDMRRIDEDLIGQGLRLPARDDVVLYTAVSFDGSELVPGCLGEDYLGIVASIDAPDAYIVLAGNAIVNVPGGANTGDYVYAQDNGTGLAVSVDDVHNGLYSHKRIIGTCISGGTGPCPVMVRSRNWFGALANVDALAAEAMILCAPGAESAQPYLLSAAVCDHTGTIVPGYSLETSSNIASITVDANKMRFTFAHAYTGLPSVEFQSGVTTRHMLNKYVTAQFATAKLYDSTGAPLNFADVTGTMSIVAKGAAA